jgi:hypothetical protein
MTHKPAIRRIGILVVHGVGDQTCFEHLEHIATNLWEALSQNGYRLSPAGQKPTLQQTQPFVQIRRGTEIPYRATIGTSWREPAASVTWWDPAHQRWTEAVFQEIHWSDLQMPLTFWNWLKLVSWALCIWMVRLFDTSSFWRAGVAVNRAPEPLTSWEKWRVRGELFITSLLFVLMLSTVGLIYLVASRFSEATWIRRVYALIYNYLGDVKLYQDYFTRTEPDLEVIGEKSRVAIRRRMVRAVIQMAKACRTGELDGYFIMAHSLGTVVAYNALMDAEDILPNYLTYDEWSDPALHPFKTTVAPADECTLPQEPRRPPWLAPGEGLNRSRLFEHCEGILTIGSPLNKFAALWPAIVPMHRDPLWRKDPVPWVNVADAQDIVGGLLTLFRNGIPTNPKISLPGLQLFNLAWASEQTPFTAHTSYWKPGKDTDRLVNRMIHWLEGNTVNVLPLSSPSKVARYRMLRWVWIILSATVCLWVAAEMCAILYVWFIR